MSAGVELDAGSFPHPDSRGSTPTAVLRALSDRGAQDWRALAAGRLFPRGTDTHPGYGEALFERMLGQAFAVARREVLPSGARMLYHARPR